MEFEPSSVTSSEPSCATVMPTGLPQTASFFITTPVRGLSTLSNRYGSKSLYGRNDYLLFWNGFQHRHPHLQMLIHQEMRRVCHPLRQRDVLVIRALEHLKKDQIRVARILDVRRVGCRNVSDIALLEIHRS